MLDYNIKYRNIQNLWADFIEMLDKIGFTCENSKDLIDAYVLFSELDYTEQEAHLLRLYLGDNDEEI